MNSYKIYFSPTGGTKNVASAICKKWPKGKDVDLSVMNGCYDGLELEEDALVVIAMPVFGGVAPQVALDRLKMIKGNGAKCVVVAVYGNRDFDDTLIQMSDYAKEAGFVVIAGIAAVAEHSIARRYAAGRPDARDRKELTEYGDKIFKKMRAGDFSAPSLPGYRPYKKPGAGMVPSAGSNCTACGLCAKNCPVGAISKDQPKNCDKSKCIGCMRCVSICPSGARNVSKVKLAVVNQALKKACLHGKPNELML